MLYCLDAYILSVPFLLPVFDVIQSHTRKRKCRVQMYLDTIHYPLVHLLLQQTRGTGAIASGIQKYGVVLDNMLSP